MKGVKNTVLYYNDLELAQYDVRHGNIIIGQVVARKDNGDAVIHDVYGGWKHTYSSTYLDRLISS